MKKLLIITFLFAITISSNAQVSVIANKSVSEASIDKQAVSMIYSLSKTRWDNGSKIAVYEQSGESSTKTQFYNFIGKDQLTLKKEWLKKQLTGEAKAPESLGSDDAVINAVSSTPGAIGYVKSSSVNASVKVIAEIK